MLSILRLRQWSRRLTELVLYQTAFNPTPQPSSPQRTFILEHSAYASDSARSCAEELWGRDCSALTFREQLTALGTECNKEELLAEN